MRVWRLYDLLWQVRLPLYAGGVIVEAGNFSRRQEDLNGGVGAIQRCDPSVNTCELSCALMVY